MANNYFVSSVTLYKEDNAKPFVFGPFTTALIRACSSWFDYTDGIGVCDEDDCSRQMETVLLKVYGILTGNLKVTDEAGNFYILSYSTLLPLLNKFYNIIRLYRFFSLCILRIERFCTKVIGIHKILE